MESTLTPENRLRYFWQFLSTLDGLVVVHFRDRPPKPGAPEIAITEILRPRFGGILREFEMNLASASSILEHYRLFERPTAICVQDGQYDKALLGYKNVRNHLMQLEKSSPAPSS